MSTTSQNSIDFAEKPLAIMSGHEDMVWGMAYLPGGDRLVSSSVDNTIRIWDVENGKQEGTSMKPEGFARGLAVTRDGKRILSGGDDKRVMLWDVETHHAIGESEGHTGGIWAISLSPDDQLAAIGDTKGKLIITDLKEDGEIIHSIQAGSMNSECQRMFPIVRSVCFSPNGEKLACAVTSAASYTIHVYDIESGELDSSIQIPPGTFPYVIWSLDGNQLFSTYSNYTICCWNSKTSAPIGIPWTGHTNTVTALALSPNGTKIASASCDRTIRFWDSHSGDPIKQLLQHEIDVWAVTFSPSGEFVASGGGDNKISIWRVPWWVNKQNQRFWKSPASTAVGHLTDRVKEKKKDVGPLKPQEPQTHPDPSSHAGHSGSTSNVGPSNLRGDPSTSSNIAPAACPQQHCDPHVGHITASSLVSHEADDATRGPLGSSQPTSAVVQVVSHLQEQNYQLRRQVDELVTANRKGDVERERLKEEVKASLSSSYKSRVPQNPHTHTEAGPSSFGPSNLDSINLKLEERVKEEKRSASPEINTVRRKWRRN